MMKKEMHTSNERINPILETVIFTILLLGFFLFGFIIGNGIQSCPDQEIIVNTQQHEAFQQQLNSSAFIDSASPEFKERLIWARQYKPELYTQMSQYWTNKQSMELLSPFEVTERMEAEFDRCYSDSFGGRWECH